MRTLFWVFNFFVVIFLMFHYLPFWFILFYFETWRHIQLKETTSFRIIISLTSKSISRIFILKNAKNMRNLRQSSERRCNAFHPIFGINLDTLHGFIRNTFIRFIFFSDAIIRLRFRFKYIYNTQIFLKKTTFCRIVLVHRQAF